MRMGARFMLLSSVVTALTAPVLVSVADAQSANSHAVRVCAKPAAGSTACDAQVLARPDGSPAVTAGPTGYGPADIQSAYNLPAGGAGRTVAVVDAYGYPNLDSDLRQFRSAYNLPECSLANKCLRVVNQNGGSTLPNFSLGWAQETALDVDAISSACPSCNILVVEASSTSLADLGAGVNRAVAMGAIAVSNSYGGGDASDKSNGAAYNHPGVAVTASTGDGGYGVEYPASSSYVTAVGGTSLKRSGSSWTETAWSGAGSGCSSYNAAVAPASANTGCAKRAVADVAAVADPYTGLSVFGPYNRKGASGWQVYGGTSLSSPIIAAVYALSGNTGSAATNTYANSLPYRATTGLNDVTSGSNGSCTTAQWCNAGTGWDGPTGLGTPNGTSAF